MPSYDPAFRVNSDSFVGNTGATSAVLSRRAAIVNNDLIIVTGKVGNGAQINAPDGTWTRINSVVTSFQCFWKRSGGSEPSSYTFTWDGSNQPNVFNIWAFYSQGGGTVSLDTVATSEVGSATAKTSDAVTPSANALVAITYQEFVVNEPGPPTGPGGLTQDQAVGGFGSPSIWSGHVYIASGTSSGTFTASNNSGDPNTPFHWSSGTFSITSSIVNPLTPPFIDDEVVYAPSMAQTFHPPFIDDELVFAPSVGIGSMHTTTSNSEVALQLSSAGTNLRITEQSSEAATQVSLLGVAQLRATQVTAEVALQVLPPIGPVDFEIQTPSRQLDPAQIGMTKRIYIDVDCNRSGPTWGTSPQVLFPTLILDNVTEVTLPAITNNGRGVIEIAFQQKSRLVAIRLANPALRGRVEVFGIHWDNPVGRDPGTS